MNKHILYPDRKADALKTVEDGGRRQTADWSKGTLGRRAAAFAGDVRSCPFSRALDDNAATFPLGQAFYADFSHDDILISVLTAMSMDYFKDAPDFTKVSKPACARRAKEEKETPNS